MKSKLIVLGFSLCRIRQSRPSIETMIRGDWSSESADTEHGNCRSSLQKLNRKIANIEVLNSGNTTTRLLKLWNLVWNEGQYYLYGNKGSLYWCDKTLKRAVLSQQYRISKISSSWVWILKESHRELLYISDGHCTANGNCYVPTVG